MKRVYKVREEHPSWKGGRYEQGGYVFVYQPDHPRAQTNGYVLEHVLVAEKALGRALPTGAVIHHVNEDRSDNRGCNLVICTRAYHALIHQRMRLLANGGHPRTHRWCTDCGPALKERFGGHKQRCRSCHAAYELARRRRVAESTRIVREKRGAA